MAVIRQRTQVFNRPFGVVRGDAGGAKIGQAIAEVASDVSEIAYREAAKNAQEAGRKAGLAIPTTDVTAIDPKTNMPVAYKPPSNFGGIAAEAYQTMIDRRFEDSVLTELQTKGSEFADKASNSKQYLELMTNYVEEMYNAGSQEAQGTYYTRYIEETGKAYVSKTFAALQEKERKAAAARLKKQSRLDYALKTIDIQKRIKAGEVSDQLGADILDLNEFALTQYVGGNATISEVTKAQELSYGFGALVANTTLTQTYVGATEPEQAQIRAALLNPAAIDQHIKDPKLQEYIITALSGEASGKQIVDALKLDLETQTQLADARDTEFLENNFPTPTMSIEELNSRLKDQSPEVRSEFIERLFQMKLEPELEATNIDSIINELSKDVSQIDENNLPESVRGLVGGMNRDDINDLVTNLKSRNSALSGTAAAELNAALQTTASAMGAMNSSTDIGSLGKSYQSAIASLDSISDKEKRNSKREAIDAKFADLAKSLVNIDSIPLDEMEDVHSAIISNATSFEGSPEAKAYFNVMSKAYKISDASISRKMSALETKKSQAIQDEVNQTILNEALNKQNGGYPNSKEEQDVLTLHYYKGTMPSAIKLAGDKDFLQRAANNSILPIELNAIELGLKSGNYGEQQAAFRLFNQLTNVQQDLGGQMVRRDYLRSRMDKDTYSLARAATSVANFRSRVGIADESPQEIYAKMFNFSGSIDSAIKKELELAQNKSLNTIFTDSDYEMTDFDRDSQQEFLDILRFNVASGTPLNEKLMNEIRDEYKETLIEDARVIGKRVGDSTHYAIDGVLDDSQQARMYVDIIREFADSPDYQEYLQLTGLTKLAAGMNPFSEEIKNRAISTQLNKYIKFEPIADTWLGDTGNRSWIVKMRAATGGYMVPMPDGFPIIVSESSYIEDPSSERSLFSYKNASIAAKASGNKVAIAETELRLLLKINPEMYSTVDSLFDIPEEYGIQEMLTPDQMQAIYNEEMGDGE